MKTILTLLACVMLAIVPAAGQPAPENPEQIKAALAITLKQRTEADAEKRDWQLQAALLADENAKLKAKIAELEKRVAELEPKKPEQPKTP